MADCIGCARLNNCGLRNVNRIPQGNCSHFRQYEPGGIPGTILELTRRLKEKARLATYEDEEANREVPRWNMHLWDNNSD